jgi:hypothetical protein
VRTASEYLINLVLPNQVGLAGISAVSADSDEVVGNWDILIGMNVITRGDFAITHRDGKTTFSFRVPPSGHIDFTNDYPYSMGSLDASVDDVGRNDYVILHKPDEPEAEKPKKKHIEKAVENPDNWELVVP